MTRREIPIQPEYIEIEAHRFCNIWLRDHCLCEECRDRDSLQKKRSPTSVPRRPAIGEAFRDGNEISIRWSEAPIHQSVFHTQWLLAHAPAAAERPNVQTSAWQVRENRILWDRGLLNNEFPSFDVATASFGEWSERLAQYGFVVLHGLTHSTFESFMAEIGPIFETEYGKTHPSIAVQHDHIPDLSMTSDAMLVHTDSTFRETQRLVQCLFAVQNETGGGESTVVDGFRVAEELRRWHPEAFRLLCSVPVDFVQLNTDKRYLFSHSTPIFALDSASSELRSVYFSDKNTSLSVGDSQVAKFYDAYRLLVDMLVDPKFVIRFRLRSGSCLITQNFRVLHGRDEFDARSGARHLDICYMPWDYFVARRRFLQFANEFRGAFSEAGRS